MRIEVWADVVCPWAYIGKRRLERTLTAGKHSAEVLWRPFRIDPMAPAVAEPLPQTLSDPLMIESLTQTLSNPLVDKELPTCSADPAPTQDQLHVSRIAAAEGLGPRWGAAWRADSRLAHRLITLAYESGGAVLQDAVVEGILHAHFIEAENISDSAVLGRVAREAGFPDGADLLASGAGDEQVRELLLRGRAIGVSTSPTLVVNGMALRGAQPPEAIEAFLVEAAGRTPARVPEEVERLRHAESLLESGDPLGALTLLRPLLDEHGDDQGVRLLAARAYFHSAQLNRAQRTLETLAVERPDDSYVQLLLGRVLQRQGRSEQAEAHLRLAAIMNPNYA